MSTSIHSRLGQLFVLETKSGRWGARIGELLRSVRPSGVVVPLSPVRPEATMREFSKCAARVLRGTPIVGIAGPQVSPVYSLLQTPSGTPPPIFNNALRKRARSLGKWEGAALCYLGVNVDFSFWLELAHPGPRLSGRTPEVPRDPRVVSQCGRAYLRGLSTTKVVACARDFPGIGSVELDQEFGGLLSSKPMAKLWREDLLSFRDLLPKLPLVSISHAGYKAYDFETPRPAVWSFEIVTGLLRAKLGYKGVVVAQIPKVFALMQGTTIGEAVVKAMEAGCDLFILPVDKSSIGKTMSAVHAALESGRISREQLDDSIRRIGALKRKLVKPSLVISEQTLLRIKRQMQAGERQMRRNG